MTKWYVWKCECGVEMRLNFHATEEQYLARKDCHCGGEFEWKYNEEGIADESRN